MLFERVVAICWSVVRVSLGVTLEWASTLDVVLTPIESEADLGLDESLVVSVKGTFEGSSLSVVRTEEISVGRSDVMFEFFAVVAVALVEELSPL